MNLKHYSALAAAFLALKNESDAQIVYTDIKDTTVTPGGEYFLDLNNDGVADFRISNLYYNDNGTDWYYSDRVSILPLGQNAIMASYYSVEVLPFGKQINNHSPWSAYQLMMEAHERFGHCNCESCHTCGHWTNSGTYGNWKNKTDHYLGLRIITGADTLYGWARLDASVLSPFCEFTLKDYAVNTIPGASIRAGEVDCHSLVSSLPNGLVALCDSCFIFRIDTPYKYSVQNISWFENNVLVSGNTLPGLQVCSPAFVPVSVSAKWTLDSSVCYSDTTTFIFLQKPDISKRGDTLISSSPVLNQWILDNTPIPGATNREYIVTKLGLYRVEVQSSDSCTLISDQLAYTGISDVVNSKKVLISFLPNKTLEVRFATNVFLNGKIRIMNVLGQPIKELTVDKNTIEIPFAENETGWFIVDVEKDEHRFYSPILIF